MSSLLELLSDDDPSSEQDGTRNDDCLNNEILMLLTSRPQINIPEPLSSLKKTVVGYGLDSDFSDEMTPAQKSVVLQERIALALHHFEPRLTKSTVQVKDLHSSTILFFIEGEYRMQPVRYVLSWDDVMGQFILR